MMVLNLRTASAEQVRDFAACALWVVGPSVYLELRKAVEGRNPFVTGVDVVRHEAVPNEADALVEALVAVWGRPRLVVDRYLPDWYVVGSMGPDDVGVLPGVSIGLVSTDTGFEMRYTFEDPS